MNAPNDVHPTLIYMIHQHLQYALINADVFGDVRKTIEDMDRDELGILVVDLVVASRGKIDIGPFFVSLLMAVWFEPNLSAEVVELLPWALGAPDQSRIPVEAAVGLLLVRIPVNVYAAYVDRVAALLVGEMVSPHSGLGFHGEFSSWLIGALTALRGTTLIDIVLHEMRVQFPPFLHDSIQTERRLSLALCVVEFPDSLPDLVSEALDFIVEHFAALPSSGVRTDSVSGSTHASPHKQRY
jgi:hypothetical protein